MEAVRNRRCVVPVAAEDPAAVEVLMAAFRDSLITERGLAGETVRCYGSQAKKFLARLPEPRRGVADAAGCRRRHHIRGRTGQGGGQCRFGESTSDRAAQPCCGSWHVQGLIQAPLVAAVPGVAGWRVSELPRVLPPAQVEALLSAHDHATPVGLRDHAVLVTLARLGLRGGEIAALRLADVDWRAGEIVVRGKGSRIERLPLPSEVGASLAGYLTGARPTCRCATMFVTAPYQPLTPGAVCPTSASDDPARSRSLARLDLSDVRRQRRGAHHPRHQVRQTPPGADSLQHRCRAPRLPTCPRPALSRVAHTRVVRLDPRHPPGSRQHPAHLRTRAAVETLRAWLAERAGQGSDPLFTTHQGTPLSRDAVAHLVAKHTAAAVHACPSIAAKTVTPHTLRHSTAMALLRAGVDISVIALRLGHESTDATPDLSPRRHDHQRTCSRTYRAILRRKSTPIQRARHPARVPRCSLTRARLLLVMSRPRTRNRAQHGDPATRAA